MNSVVELETDFYVSPAWVRKLHVVVQHEKMIEFFPRKFSPRNTPEKLFGMWKDVHEDAVILEFWSSKKLYISKQALLEMCALYVEDYKCEHDQQDGPKAMVMEFGTTTHCITLPYDPKTFNALLDAWKEVLGGSLVDLMD